MLETTGASVCLAGDGWGAHPPPSQLYVLPPRYTQANIHLRTSHQRKTGLYPSLGHAKGSWVHAQKEHFLGTLAVASHVVTVRLPSIIHWVIDDTHGLWKLQLTKFSIESKLLLQEALSQASSARQRLHQGACRFMSRPWQERLGHSHAAVTWERGIQNFLQNQPRVRICTSQGLSLSFPGSEEILGSPDRYYKLTQDPGNEGTSAPTSESSLFLIHQASYISHLSCCNKEPEKATEGTIHFSSQRVELIRAAMAAGA